MTKANYFNSEKIRVLVAHRVRVIRDGLAALLLQSPELTIIEPPPQEAGCKEPQNGSTVDVVLAFSEPATDGAADQIQGLKNTFPGAKVVVIGVSGTEKESLDYIETGVSGYVLPEVRLEHLIETIRMVYRGEASCPPDILALLFERIASLRTRVQSVQGNQLSRLTRRESEVLQLVADGMSNKEIAAHLSLELQTVKNHVHSILEKLSVRNRREAVACTQKPGPIKRDD